MGLSPKGAGSAIMSIVNIRFVYRNITPICRMSPYIKPHLSLFGENVSLGFQSMSETNKAVQRLEISDLETTSEEIILSRKPKTKVLITGELRHEKTCFLHMQKQRR